MADLTPTVNKDDIKFDLLLENRRQGRTTTNMVYDDALDSLSLMLLPEDEETAVYFVTDYVGFLFYAESFQLAGLYIEDFESAYLESHKDLRDRWIAWRDAVETDETVVHHSAGTIQFFELAIAIIESTRKTIKQFAP